MNLLMHCNKIDTTSIDFQKTKVSNFDILSQIIPNISLKYKTKRFGDDENINTSNNVLEIRNGKMYRGHIEKGVLGDTTRGLIHRIYNDYQEDPCRDFIDELQNIVTEYMKLNGYSVGISELNVGGVAAGNGVFTHNAHTFVKAQRGTIDAVSVGAANVTMDFANTNHFALTLGTNSNLNRPSNLTAGQTGSIFVIQDGTGSRTLSYSSVFDFAGGTAPTLTTTASAVDRIDYVVRSSSSIHAVATLALS